MKTSVIESEDSSRGSHRLRSAALFIHNLGSGGAQRVLCGLANALVSRGHIVTVVTVAHEGASHFSLLDDVKRVDLGEAARVDGMHGPWTRLRGFIRRWRAVRSTLRRLRPRTVVGFVGTTNVLVLLASRGLPCRVVISERNDPARQRLYQPWEWLRRRCYRWADAVTVNTEGAEEVLAGFVSRRKLHVITNPAPPVNQINDGQRRDGRLLLSVGRLHHQKGIDVLLNAFAGIDPEPRRGWRLRIVGDGEQRDALAELAQRLRIGEALEWTGQVPDPLPHYGEADVFVLASRYEGLPNVLLEAMVSGCACIVTDASPGPLELVEDGATGLVVPVEDAGALAGALARLMRAPGLRERLGAAARERVLKSSCDSITSSWEEVLWP